jgi:putative tricarboxylic transport membrane protein
MHRGNVFVGFVCLSFGLFFAWLASQLPGFTATDQLGGRFFPMLVAIGIIVCSVALIVTGFLNIEIAGGQVGGKRADQKAPSNSADSTPAAEQVVESPVLGMPAPRARLFGFIAAMAIYTLILEPVGYLVASVIVFSAMIFIAGERRPLRVLVAASLTTAVLYALFAILFGMNVPEASLF